MASLDRGLSSNIVAKLNDKMTHEVQNPKDDHAHRGVGLGASSFFPAFEKPRQLAQRIIELIDDALFQRNDSVVGDRDTLRANFGATLGDVAVTDAVGALQ